MAQDGDRPEDDRRLGCPSKDEELGFTHQCGLG